MTEPNDLLLKTEGLIRIIGKNHKITFTEIYKRSDYSKATLSKYLKQLEDYGIIKKTSCQGDQRKREYKILKKSDFSKHGKTIRCLKCHNLLDEGNIIEDESSEDEIDRIYYCPICETPYHLKINGDIDD